MIYKFVKWDVPAYSTESRLYRLHEKVENGEALTTEEKEWLQRNLVNNTYSNTGIPLGGWMYTFEKALRKVLVKQYGQWQEYWAFNKSTLKKVLYGRIQQMVYVD